MGGRLHHANMCLSNFICSWPLGDSLLAPGWHEPLLFLPPPPPLRNTEVEYWPLKIINGWMGYVCGEVSLIVWQPMEVTVTCAVHVVSFWSWWCQVVVGHSSLPMYLFTLLIYLMFTWSQWTSLYDQSHRCLMSQRSIHWCRLLRRFVWH